MDHASLQVLHCEATLENDADTASSGSISVTVLDKDGKTVGTGKSSAAPVALTP